MVSGPSSTPKFSLRRENFQVHVSTTLVHYIPQSIWDSDPLSNPTPTPSCSGPIGMWTGNPTGMDLAVILCKDMAPEPNST